MKTQTKSDRKINSITNGRWTAYMAAAAATGFAAAPTAEATIHYSGLINQRVGGTQGFNFDLGSGVTIFVSHTWDHKGPSSSRGGGDAYFGIAGPGASFKGAYFCPSGDLASASKLNKKDPIAGGSFFPGRAILAVRYGDCHGYSGDGQFDPGTGFVGFKFNTGAGIQYGWARITMYDECCPTQNRFKLVDYAYGDPGETVLAGQRESNDSSPDLESLGALALGGAGLMAWRRRSAR
jgi:hypothetical protein